MHSKVREPKMNTLEKRVFEEAYKMENEGCESLCEGICQKAKPPLEKHGPLSFFNVGDEYEKDRILFVGKNTWYDKGDVDTLKNYPGSKFKDCRADGKEMFSNPEKYPSRYWGCLREITQALYPQYKTESSKWEFDKLWDRVAVTNLTKCNTSLNSLDTTPYGLTRYCIPFFEAEVTILQPKYLVLFTSKGYDRYIKDLRFEYSKPPIDVTDQENRKHVRNGTVCWWEREFSDDKKGTMRFLRTRHPVRAPKALVNEIVAWLKDENLS